MSHLPALFPSFFPTNIAYSLQTHMRIALAKNTSRPLSLPQSILLSQYKRPSIARFFEIRIERDDRHLKTRNSRVLKEWRVRRQHRSYSAHHLMLKC